MNKRHIAAVTVLLAAAVVPVAHADIINVPGDQPTIQAGIDAAFGGDEIVVAPGTYFETINFLGKAIWLHSSDGAGVTTMDGQQQGSVVTSGPSELCNQIALPRKSMFSKYVPGATTISSVSTALSMAVWIEQYGSSSDPSPPGQLAST